MSQYQTAIIGGTGFNDWPGFTLHKETTADTTYGPAAAPLRFGEYAQSACLFLPRHGDGHRIPPHQINYRANIQALADAGVKRIIAIAAVGGISADLPPGAVAIPDQIIDYTTGRVSSFWDGPDDFDAEPLHVDFTEPYTPALRQLLLQAATTANANIVDGGTCGVTQGPRLESAAEIRRLRQDGCTMVGMTSMPEAALARERNMEYASLAVSVNWAAGLHPDPSVGIHDQIIASLASGIKTVQAILEQALPILADTE